MKFSGSTESAEAVEEYLLENNAQYACNGQISSRRNEHVSDRQRTVSTHANAMNGDSTCNQGVLISFDGGSLAGEEYNSNPISPTLAADAVEGLVTLTREPNATSAINTTWSKEPRSLCQSHPGNNEEAISNIEPLPLEVAKRFDSESEEYALETARVINMVTNGSPVEGSSASAYFVKEGRDAENEEHERMSRTRKRELEQLETMINSTRREKEEMEKIIELHKKSTGRMAAAYSVLAPKDGGYVFAPHLEIVAGMEQLVGSTCGGSKKGGPRNKYKCTLCGKMKAKHVCEAPVSKISHDKPTQTEGVQGDATFKVSMSSGIKILTCQATKRKSILTSLRLPSGETCHTVEAV